jgi:hypothetical protein
LLYAAACSLIEVWRFEASAATSRNHPLHSHSAANLSQLNGNSAYLLSQSRFAMEAIGLVASVIAIVQISGACLKLSLKPLGPSSYKPERLQSLSTTLYGFNGNIRNLQTLLEIYEDDQARLDTLNHLQEPLTKCHEALQLLNSRLQSDGFFAQYIMGSKFDKKFELCLRVLNDAKDLLELSLQCDQRYTYIWKASLKMWRMLRLTGFL